MKIKLCSVLMHSLHMCGLKCSCSIFSGTSSDHKVTNANAALQASCIDKEKDEETTSRYESVWQQTVDSFKRHEGKQLPVYSGYSSFSKRSTRLITKRSY
jgi:hypothetical protein